jgi:hypothetical protein
MDGSGHDMPCVRSNRASGAWQCQFGCIIPPDFKWWIVNETFNTGKT